MSKLKSIFTGEHKFFAWFCVIALLCFIISWIFGPGNTFHHWIKAKRETRAQEELIEKYKNEIEEMERQYKDLNSNRDSLEKFAREKFGFTDGKEDIYLIEEKK